MISKGLAILAVISFSAVYAERDSRFGISQVSSSDFLAETKDNARDKTRIEGKKYEEKLTRLAQNIQSRAVYGSEGLCSPSLQILERFSEQRLQISCLVRDQFHIKERLSPLKNPFLSHQPLFHHRVKPFSIWSKIFSPMPAEKISTRIQREAVREAVCGKQLPYFGGHLQEEWSRYFTENRLIRFLSRTSVAVYERTEEESWLRGFRFGFSFSF